MDCKAPFMAADELINIHEMSERSSVPASTLRYYEKLGLITSERGRSGSHRRYSESTFHRLRRVSGEASGAYRAALLGTPLVVGTLCIALFTFSRLHASRRRLRGKTLSRSST
jgi:hypothetical protein